MEITKGKYIAVDDFQQTSAPGVYALGDVCGKVELTPVAIAAGRRLADRFGLHHNDFFTFTVEHQAIVSGNPIVKLSLQT